MSKPFDIDLFCKEQSVNNKHYGLYARLAFSRHLREVEHSERRDFPFKYNENIANHILTFTEQHICVSGGRIVLLDWQRFVLCSLFGWVKKSWAQLPQEQRPKLPIYRFRQAYLSMGRKNGKSTMAALILLLRTRFALSTTGSYYLIATKQEQALITFSMILDMIKASPRTLNWLQKKRKGLFIHSLTGRELRVIASKAETMDGLNVNTVIVDEFHAHHNRNMLDKMLLGTGQQASPLTLITTTAGPSIHSACYREQQALEQGLTSKEPSEHYFAMIFQLDKKDDWKDTQYWHKCNPSLGVIVYEDNMVKDYESMKEEAVKLYNFRIYRLNQWGIGNPSSVDFHKAFLNCTNLAKYRRKEGNVLVPEKKQDTYIGLDLSSHNALSCVCKLVAYQHEGKLIRTLEYQYFMAEYEYNRYERKRKADYETLQLHIEKGTLTICPGETISLSIVIAHLDRLLKEVRSIRMIATDAHRLSDLRNYLEHREQDPNTKRFSDVLRLIFPSMPHYSIQDFFDSVIHDHLIHDHNAITLYHAQNCTFSHTGRGGTIRLDMKDHMIGKDGISASIHAYWAYNEFHNLLRRAAEKEENVQGKVLEA